MSMNINAATREDLVQQVPDLSAVWAEKIIDYRNNNGAFTSMQELSKVPGLTESAIGDVAKYFTIGDSGGTSSSSGSSTGSGKQSVAG